MNGQQSVYLPDGDGNRPSGPNGQPDAGFLGVGGLHPDQQRGRRQHAETEGDHECSLRSGQMHVGELVAPFVDAQRADVEYLGALDHHGARRPPEVDGIDDEQQGHTVPHQLLDEVNTADADLQHLHVIRQWPVQQRLGHRRPHSVIGAQNIAEAGHECAHDERIGGVTQSEQEVLTERLDRYPPDRYPVQYATTQFHLGSVLLNSGDALAALVSLSVARDVFARVGVRLEAAKAGMLGGVALRAVGRIPEARASFTAAVSDFAALDQFAEQAAASYNLGLVCQDLGDSGGAYTAWSTARELFLTVGYPAQAAAAARDHGGCLLADGDVAAATSLLREAVALAEHAADTAGLGAASNILGLAHLSADDPAAAIAALRSALACFPRSVRPADHAMVKANLALAYEQAGELPRARLAARQALALSSAAAPVRRLAREVLARLPGPEYVALLAVLDIEDPDHWQPTIREEVLRLAESSAVERNREIRGLLDGLLARPGACYDLAESLLAIVLELPPGSYATLVTALVAGTGGRAEQDAERLRSVFGSAMARFALPQWQRIAASLNAAATAAGEPAQWR